MCCPAGFVVTRHEVFWSKTSNSHSAIIAEHALHVDGVRGPNVVSVEIVPEDGDYTSDTSKWTFGTNQGILPNWYSQDDVERRARAELPEWRRYHGFSQEGGLGAHLAGGDAMTQTAGDCSVQVAGDYSVQTAGGEGVQRAGQRSSQAAGDCSTQTASSQSTQTANSCSAQTAGACSTQTSGDYSTQTASSRSMQTAGARSAQVITSCGTQIAGDYSTQTSGNHSTQTAGFHSTQTAGDHSMQTAGDFSVQITGDRSAQKAGIGTVQVTRWVTNVRRVATRVLTQKEANRWWFVEAGFWRLCTHEEIAQIECAIANPTGARS